MKLNVSLFFLWILSSSVGALDCNACANAQCSQMMTKTCGSESMCITASIMASSSGTTGQQIYKDCASSSLCPTTGTAAFSVNLGFAGAMATAECCNSNNCNSATLSFPTAQTANSLQCVVCNPSTSQCTSTVQCTGQETTCLQATVTNGSSTYPALGCATANTCAAAASVGTLPFMSNVGSISSGPGCCTTSSCNAPKTTTTTTTTPTTTTTTPTTTTTTPTTTTTTPTTTTTTPTTTTTSKPTSSGCCVTLSMLHIMFGLLIFLFL